MRPVRGRPVRTALLIAAAALSPAPGAVGAQERPEADRAAALAAGVAALERRVELATSDVFYLLLDASASELRLMFGGAVLQSYPFVAADVGRPRTSFVGVSDPSDWQSTIWQTGTLVPSRPVEERQIQPPEPGAEEELPPPVVPPTAEEAIPVPDRYRVRFDGGFALEIRRTAPDGESGWWRRVRGGWSRRWQDVRSALRRSDRDVLRVRITMEPSSADALYRALPPDVRLLVVSAPGTASEGGPIGDGPLPRQAGGLAPGY